MYLEVDDLASLVSAIQEDEKSVSECANRYPVRFILFDDFAQCNQALLQICHETHVQIKFISDILFPDGSPDYLPTHSQICDIVKRQESSTLFSPFFQYLAFCDQNVLDAVVHSLLGIEASQVSRFHSYRIYIPIVGMYAEMRKRLDKNNAYVWYLKDRKPRAPLEIIIANKSTIRPFHRVKCEKIQTVKEWFNLVKVNTDTRIVCSSDILYCVRDYPRSDNAFRYTSCENIYELMKYGFSVDINDSFNASSDKQYLEQLAERLDYNEKKPLENYLIRRFNGLSLYNLMDFIRSWFSTDDQADRWALCKYMEGSLESYPHILTLFNYTTAELFEKIALWLPESQNDIKDRADSLKYIKEKKNVNLTKEAANTLCAYLKEKPAKEAIKYVVGISPEEKKLVLSWFVSDEVSLDDLKNAYTDLYYYLQPGCKSSQIPWLEEYFYAYKTSKIRCKYSDNIRELIGKLNASSASFVEWYDSVKTTRTYLAQFSGIDVCCWIDGLGLDWVALIRHIVKANSDLGMYINEVSVTRSLLPSTTSINREELLKYSDNIIPISKDETIDSLAHKSIAKDNYYDKLVKEIEVLKDSVLEIISQNQGKKIAIVSDHGISYLPQLLNGLNIKVKSSDHHGRVATLSASKPSAYYYEVGRDNLVCALSHYSLTSKVPVGLGCHGGCTPEEVLTPVIILSPEEHYINWSIMDVQTRKKGMQTILIIKLSGVGDSDVVQLSYKGRVSDLTPNLDKSYESKPLGIVSSSFSVDVIVNGIAKSREIHIDSSPIESDDLFDF